MNVIFDLLASAHLIVSVFTEKNYAFLDTKVIHSTTRAAQCAVHSYTQQLTRLWIETYFVLQRRVCAVALRKSFHSLIHARLFWKKRKKRGRRKYCRAVSYPKDISTSGVVPHLRHKWRPSGVWKFDSRVTWCSSWLTQSHVYGTDMMLTLTHFQFHDPLPSQFLTQTASGSRQFANVFAKILEQEGNSGSFSKP